MVKGRSELQMQLTVTTPLVKRGFRKARVCAAMKAPVRLLSGGAVCVSRWRGFAPTSSEGFSESRIKNDSAIYAQSNAERIFNR